MTLRCGRIKYTNDLPIYAAFDAGVIEYPGTLHADVPARLNAMLLRDELDLSPISAFTWAENWERLVLLPDLCIGARDEVISVVLISAVPPKELDGVPVYVSEESASGRYLLRVILERRYGLRPRYFPEPTRSSDSPRSTCTTSGRSGTSGRDCRRSSPSGPPAATFTSAIPPPSPPACTR
jgi:chorismate dehydratase